MEQDQRKERALQGSTPESAPSLGEIFRNHAEMFLRITRQAIVLLDKDLLICDANPEFYKLYGVTPADTLGKCLCDSIAGHSNVSGLREYLTSACSQPDAVSDFEVEHHSSKLGIRTLAFTAVTVGGAAAQAGMLLATVREVARPQQRSDPWFQRVFETAKDGIVVVENNSEIVRDVNTFFLKMTGLQREDVVNHRLTEAAQLVGWSNAAEVIRAAEQAEIVHREDLVLTNRAGDTLTIDLMANRYSTGQEWFVQLNLRDITARTNAIRALQESEARFRLFVENVRDYAIFQLDTSGHVLTWNAGAERLLGWTETEVLGKYGSFAFVPEDRASGVPERELETARLYGRAEDERWHLRKDGGRFFASGVMTAVRGPDQSLVGFAKVMRDITVRQQHEQQLKRSLEEKIMLVREMHHRVKNNLQVIVSLLSLQSDYIDDPNLAGVFEEIQDRVRAIARLHEQLYVLEDPSDIEMGKYLIPLAEELVALHSRTPERVNLELEVENLLMCVEQAVPLGLIANELLLNSLKHGLRAGAGRIKVVLEYQEDGVKTAAGTGRWVKLRVVDDGPGLPESVSKSEMRTLGLRLVNLLARQLAGKLEMSNSPGADIAVSFELKERGSV